MWLLIASASTTATLAQSIFLVDDSSPATSPDGSTWAMAFQDLQDALEIADPGDIVLVAEGTYSPSPNRTDNIVSSDLLSGSSPTPRHHSFVFKEPCSVIGGFLGYPTGNTNPLAPDGISSNTVIWGDVTSTPLDIRDNSHHVVFIDGSISDNFASQKVRISRCKIERGYAYPDLDSGGNPISTSSAKQGAGIMCLNGVVELTDVILEWNFAEQNAGAAFIENAAIRTLDCVVQNNRAVTGAAGIFIGSLMPTDDWQRLNHIINTRFISNIATEGAGGAIFAFGPFPETPAPGNHKGLVVLNSLFHGNHATVAGAIVVAAGSTRDSLLVNNTIAFNHGFDENAFDKAGGIFVLSEPTPATGSVEIVNCIVKYNTAQVIPAQQGDPDRVLSNVETEAGFNADVFMTHCNVGGGISSGNPWNSLPQVMDLPPQFINPSTGDFRLTASSPCVEVGNDTYLPRDYMDIDGNGITLAESTPRDLDKLWYLNGMPQQAFREMFTPPNTVLVTGVDDTSGLGRPTIICDMGCFETPSIEGPPPSN